MEVVIVLLVMLLGVSHAPVSSVLLVPECLSQGNTGVSCSSEVGDSLQYNWTLNGNTLTDAQLLSGNKDTNNITLKQGVSGLLVCSVNNKVNSISTELNISTCEFINCTLSNGTNISQWVFSATNTLCIDPTTTPTTTTVGVETHCDGRQDGAQCYGALGGTLVIRLMDNALEKFRYRWIKNKTDVIFVWQNNNIEHNELKDRSFFTASNGTFRINNLIRTDDGEYTLNINNPDGQVVEERTLQLLIQATNTLCIDPTTTSTTTTVGHSLLVCGLEAVVVLFLLAGICIYFTWKKKKYEKAETSTEQRTMDHPENSFAMIEM
ncbi:hypothetical protein PAMP_023661 [Pampus punctatissimus]